MTPCNRAKGGDGINVKDDTTALSLVSFIKEYAPNLPLSEASLTIIQKTHTLREMLVLPLPACRRVPHITHAECREPVSSLVDDVVWTLVQRQHRFKRLKKCHLQVRRRRRRGGGGGVTATTNEGRDGMSAAVPTASGLGDQTVEPSNPSFLQQLEDGKNVLSYGFVIPNEGDPIVGAASVLSSSSLSSSATGPAGRMRHGVFSLYPNENVAYCKSSSIVRQLHVMVGDELLRTIFLQTRVLFPLLPANNQDRTNTNATAGHDDGLTTTTATTSRGMGNGGSLRGNYLLLCGPPLKAAPTVRRGRAFTEMNASDLSQRGSKKRNGGGDNTVRRGDEGNGMLSNDAVQLSRRKKRRRRGKTPLQATTTATITIKTPGPVVPVVASVPVVPTISDHLSRGKLGPNESISRFPLLYFDSYIPRVGLPKSHPFEQCCRQSSQPTAGQELYEMLLKSIFEDRARENKNNKNKQRRLRKRLFHSFPNICDRILHGHKRCDYARLLERYCGMPSLLQDGHGSMPDNGDDVGTDTLAQLAKAYTSRHHVVAFVGSILKRVFPLEFWGSQGNFDSMMTTVSTFVHLRRKERLANKNIIRGIRITKMKWLFSVSSMGTTNLSGTTLGKNNQRPKSKPFQRSNHEAVTRLTLQVLRWVFQEFIIPLLRSNFYVTETEFSSQQIQYYRKPVWSRFRSLAMKTLLHKQKQQRQGHFEQISYVEARNMLLTNGRQMGLSRLRLLPKSTGVRPIAQLSRSQNHIKILFPPNAATSSGTKRSRDGDVTHNGPTATSKRPRLQNVGPHHLSQTSEVTDSSAFPCPRGPSRLPTNTILGQVFDILRYECSQRDRPFGVGMDSLASFYPRYHRYIRRLRTKDGTTERGKLKLYFGCVDIEKCYDRIDQDWLLNLVEKLMTQNSYMVQQLKLDKCASLAQTPASLTATSTHYRKLVRPLDEYNPLHTGQHPLIHLWEGTVFELIKCSLAERTKIVSLLGEHVRSHMVVTGGRYQRKILLQASGISQGSVLSTTLCNLYYGFVEKAIFRGPFVRPNEQVSVPFIETESENDACSGGSSDGGDDDFMARFVDDFIFISPDPNSLRTFLAKSCRGKPDLGAVINPDKSLVSTEMTLPPTVQDPSLDDSGVQEIIPPSVVFPTCNRKNRYGTVLFPWCGFLFDTDTGEVRMDYERFHGGRIRNSLTVDFDGVEGTRMKLRMQSFVVPRCLPILYDSSINSHETVITNFYQMMLLTAAKTAEYVRTQNGRNVVVHNRCGGKNRGVVLSEVGPSFNVNHLINCIHDLYTFASWNIRRVLKKSCPSKRHSRFCIPKRVTEYLTWTAFYHVFSYLLDFQGIAERIVAELPLLVTKVSSVTRSNKGGSTEYLQPILTRSFEDFQLRHMISRKP